MAPIRVGIIGLSAKAPGLGPGSWAVNSFLPSFTNSPEYEIVALCNSSVEAAKRAIDMHKLPESTRAYDSPEKMANDPDVDLVVVTVVVTKHLQLAMPALASKKQVFVEWPLGATVEEAEQMTELAKKNGLKTVVGLQTRSDPAVVKLKEIIESGEIGEIRSTSVLGAFPAIPPIFWTEETEQYLDIRTGANIFHVSFGHFLDSFTHIVGDFDFSTLTSILKSDITETPVYSADRTKVVKESRRKTAPDHILALGQLQNGATASINFRTSAEPTDGVGFRWIITGSKGEVELTTKQGQWQAYSIGKKIRVKTLGGEVRDVELEGVDHGVAGNVPVPGINTALLLDSYAKGKEGQFADFGAALKNHRLLEEILKKSGIEY